MNNLYTKKSTINGSGLYTKTAIKKGNTVDYIHGPIVVFRAFTPTVSKKMLNWIGVGRFSWIDTTKSPFRYINHSCDPNTALITKRKVVAIKNIAAETELTMDYSLNEAEPDWKLETCGCGAKNCRGEVGPIQTLSPAVFRQKKKYIPAQFQKIFSVEQKTK